MESVAGWKAALVLQDGAPDQLGARVLDAVDRSPDLARVVQSIFAGVESTFTWESWPDQPSDERILDAPWTSTDDFGDFAWGYLVNVAEGTVKLHSVYTLRYGRPPLEVLTVTANGRVPTRFTVHSFEIIEPTPTDVERSVAEAHSLTELLELFDKHASDSGWMSAMEARVPPPFKVEFPRSKELMRVAELSAPPIAANETCFLSVRPDPDSPRGFSFFIRAIAEG